MCAFVTNKEKRLKALEGMTAYSGDFPFSAYLADNGKYYPLEYAGVDTCILTDEEIEERGIPEIQIGERTLVITHAKDWKERIIY